MLPTREDEPASTSGYSVHGGFLWVEISCLPTPHLVRCFSFSGEDYSDDS